MKHIILIFCLFASVNLFSQDSVRIYFDYFDPNIPEYGVTGDDFISFAPMHVRYLPWLQIRSILKENDKYVAKERVGIDTQLSL